MKASKIIVILALTILLGVITASSSTILLKTFVNITLFDMNNNFLGKYENSHLYWTGSEATIYIDYTDNNSENIFLTGWKAYNASLYNYGMYYRSDYKKYTYTEGRFTSDYKMKELASQLKKSTVEETIMATLEWADYNLAYMTSTAWQKSAMMTFSKKSGVCEDHATLIVSLLRLNGIPTRLVEGINPSTTTPNNGHAWAETLYPDKDGWLYWKPIDSLSPNYYKTNYIKTGETN